MIIAIIVIAWLFIGGYAFVWWWTKELDVTTSELPILTLYALLGPVTLIGIACLLVITNSSEKVIFKKKKK